jgi:hypothetical protein
MHAMSSARPRTSVPVASVVPLTKAAEVEAVAIADVVVGGDTDRASDSN